MKRVVLLFISLCLCLNAVAQTPIRIGIIGLDTSHSTAFTELVNSGNEAWAEGFKVVAAYPYGSQTIESSYKRIPEYTDKVKQHGVKIVDSIADLLKEVDCVLLETNDGRLHLEQAVEVFKAGKICFIDKPIGATLGEAIAIYAMADKYNIPIFSSSALRSRKCSRILSWERQTISEISLPSSPENRRFESIFVFLPATTSSFDRSDAPCIFRVYPFESE